MRNGHEQMPTVLRHVVPLLQQDIETLALSSCSFCAFKSGSCCTFLQIDITDLIWWRFGSGCSAINTVVLVLGHLLSFMQIKPLLAKDAKLVTDYLENTCKCSNIQLYQNLKFPLAAGYVIFSCKSGNAMGTNTEPCYM